jgi:uncharacterized protein (AIM24 family)
MDQNTLMETNMGGGGGLGGMLGGMLKRAVTGESLFVVDYKAARDAAMVAFSSAFPGKILPINLGPGQTMLAQKGAFMTAEKTVQFGIAFNRKLGAGLFGGEGFILQQFTGPGTLFASFDGELVEYTLGPNERPCATTLRWSRASRIFCLGARGCSLPRSPARAVCGCKPCRCRNWPAQ